MKTRKSDGHLRQRPKASHVVYVDDKRPLTPTGRSGREARKRCSVGLDRFLNEIDCPLLTIRALGELYLVIEVHSGLLVAFSYQCLKVDK